MGIFTPKKLIKPDEFFSHYYKLYLSFLVPTSEGGAATLKILDWMSKDDDAYANYPAGQFLQELMIFYFEAINHVWQCRFSTSYDMLADQSMFSKDYLTSRGYEHFWDGMHTYNETISEIIATISEPNSRSNLARFAMLNSQRIETADRLIDKGYDEEAVIRIINRIGDTSPWTRADSSHAEQLSSVLQSRLLPDSQTPPSKPLIFYINSIYKGHWEEMKRIKI